MINFALIFFCLVPGSQLASKYQPALSDGAFIATYSLINTPLFYYLMAHCAVEECKANRKCIISYSQMEHFEDYRNTWHLVAQAGTIPLRIYADIQQNYSVRESTKLEILRFLLIVVLHVAYKYCHKDLFLFQFLFLLLLEVLMMINVNGHR